MSLSIYQAIELIRPGGLPIKYEVGKPFKNKITNTVVTKILTDNNNQSVDILFENGTHIQYVGYSYFGLINEGKQEGGVK